MTEKTLTTTIRIFENMDKLPARIHDLMNTAFQARDKAYAPYSKFYVGAAVLLENNEIVAGSNQENASYPSGICAERTAVYYAGAQFPDQKIRAIALSAKSADRHIIVPTPPCGACRQAIAEYECKQGQAIEIFFMGESGKVACAASLSDILPFAFDRTFL